MMPRRNELGVAQAPPPPPLPTAPPEVQLNFIVQQLYRLVQIGEQLIGQVPIVLEPKIVPGLVSVPLDPEVLNRAIQAVTPLGKARFGTTRGAVLCPAGLTTSWTHYMMTNYYCTDREIYFSADFYDPLIVVNIYVDDHLVTPYGIQLTGPGPLNFGDYYVKKTKVDVVAVNATATPCVISSHWNWTSLEKSFYDEFYRPILNYMYRSLEEVARGQV